MSSFAHFFKTEAAGGVVLIIAAALGMIAANLPLTGLHHVLHDHAVHFIINDALMAIFFLVVGCEIKREIRVGALSNRASAMLPILAAIGGMLVPAGIYVLVNSGLPANLPGWAIPSATDIAFAVCVMTLVGSRIPASIKILLLAIAVMDDLGAIVIIALFYGHGFHIVPMIGAAIVLIIMALFNRRNVTSPVIYIALGVVLWACIMRSGLHGTLAGVITALFIPMGAPLDKVEHLLHPWVAFLVLPLFGFVNAGVPLAGISLSSLAEPVTMGIALGLLLGKPIGIFLVLFLAIRFGLSPMPPDSRWSQLFGLSIVCGIGFTMSLFIGNLAFDDVIRQTEIRLGVLAGSLVAAVIGYGVLRYGSSKPNS